MIKRAMISVTDKTGIVQFAADLKVMGFEIVSTGGTAKRLEEHGIEVTPVELVTGFPEILGGRVKTLHPKIHGGILASLDAADHMADLERYKIQPFGMVVVDLYHVKDAIAKKGIGVSSVIEEIDIGGVAMIRAAAKNHRNVIVIADPADRGWVLEKIKASGNLSEEHRLELAKKVFSIISEYDGAIWKFLAAQSGEVVDTLALKNGRQLAYAENRCQNPAHLFAFGSGDPLAMTQFFPPVSGDPGFISVADGSQILEILCLIAEAFRRWKGKVPFIAIAGKHGNPCGTGISWSSPEQAVLRALYGDTTAVMGGEVVANFNVDGELAQVLFAVDVKDVRVGRGNWGLDIVMSPGFSSEADDLLGKRERRRLLANPALLEPSLPPDEFAYRPVRGGFLRQMAPKFVLTPEAVQHWSGDIMSDEAFSDLIIAWACCWRASSNTVALAKGGMLIGLGCGQQDRIACVRLCLDRANKAGHSTFGSVFSSDAFFPYAEASSELPEDEALQCRGHMDKIAKLMREGAPVDGIIKLMTFIGDIARLYDKREGPQLLADAGCIGGVVPADGKELPKVQTFFEQNEMSVAFIAPENRGFSKH